MKKRLLFWHFVLVMPFIAVSQTSTTQAKAFGITASLPLLNGFNYYNYNAGKADFKWGFMGFGGAVFYRAGANKFSLNIALAGNASTPFTRYGHDDLRSGISAYYIEGLYHRKLADVSKKGRMIWNAVAGVNFTRYRYFWDMEEDALDYTVGDKTMGITIGTEIAFGNILAIGVFYRPSIISFDKKRTWQVLSLEARIDIDLRKKRRKSSTTSGFLPVSTIYTAGSAYYP